MPWNQNDYYAFFLIVIILIVAALIAAYILLSKMGGYWHFPSGSIDVLVHHIMPGSSYNPRLII